MFLSSKTMKAAHSPYKPLSLYIHTPEKLRLPDSSENAELLRVIRYNLRSLRLSMWPELHSEWRHVLRKSRQNAACRFRRIENSNSCYRHSKGWLPPNRSRDSRSAPRATRDTYRYYRANRSAYPDRK